MSTFGATHSFEAMMNLYPQNKNNRRQRRRLFAATALVLLILAADIFSSGKIRTSVRQGGGALWSVGVGAFARVGQSGFFTSRASLAHENQLLKGEIAQLQEQKAAYSALNVQNAQLRAIVHLAQAVPGLTAPVISSLKASPYGTFMIGAGQQDGIAKNSVVATADGSIIGRVADVSAHRSLVSELFAPGSNVEALVGSTPVVLTGEGGGNAQGNLPRGASVAIGDAVFSPALGQRVIGIVGKVEAGAASASTKIYVRSPVNLESLSFVYVETTH